MKSPPEAPLLVIAPARWRPSAELLDALAELLLAAARRRQQLAGGDGQATARPAAPATKQ